MRKNELQEKLDKLSIDYKKRDTIAILTEKLNDAVKKVNDAIEHHEKYSRSYFWSNDNGNTQQRARKEKDLNFVISISDNTYYKSQVSISRKNFYYKGIFVVNSEKVTLREWRKLLKNINIGEES